MTHLLAIAAKDFDCYIHYFLSFPHIHHTPDTVSLLHDLERTVNFGQRFPVRDELVYFQLALQVIIHEVRELGAPLDASKCAPFPYAASDELEGCQRGISGKSDKLDSSS